jgi:hypothetical protein
MNESKKPGSRYQHQRARIELTDRGFSVEDINRIEVSWMQSPRVTVGLGEARAYRPQSATVLGLQEPADIVHPG